MTPSETLEPWNPLWSENHRQEASLEIDRASVLVDALLDDVDAQSSSLTPNEFLVMTRKIKLHIGAAEMAARCA